MRRHWRKELGDTDKIAKAISEGDDFATMRKIERAEAETTAILTGKARHLVLQRMWKGEDRDRATLWVYSKDNMQKARNLYQAAHVRDVEESNNDAGAMGVSESVRKRIPLRADFREHGETFRGGMVGVEWYRGARTPLCRTIWPVTNLGALGELLDLI